MQQDIWEEYQASHPGQFQLLGADIYNGMASQVESFRGITGATYPVLLQAATATGGNLSSLYGPYDNYVVINKQGIVRLNTYPSHAHGARYILEEIRGCIDSLLTATVGVEESPVRALALSALPNPFRHTSAVELVLPERAREARVEVFDLAGRSIRSLVAGSLEPGTHRWTWDGRTNQGERVRAGIYLIRATVGDRTLSRRITRLE